ncbi:MAG: tRNA dimethylallyltransferase 2, partial [Parcubacteria group bacterium GW2011_GWF2_39_13b]
MRRHGIVYPSIVDGLIIPEVPPDAKLRAKLEKLAIEKLFIKLQKLDPRRAENIDRHNRRRLIRALEIVIKTKRPVPSMTSTPYSVIPARFAIASARRAKAGIQNIDGDDTKINFLQLGIGQPKEKLKKLIKKRLLKRLKQGMIAEVIKLHKQGVSWKRLEEFGLEYRAVAQYLQKKLSKQEMIDKIQKESEQYAKRQMTWFKRDARIKWIKNYK